MTSLLALIKPSSFLFYAGTACIPEQQNNPFCAHTVSLPLKFQSPSWFPWQAFAGFEAQCLSRTSYSQYGPAHASASIEVHPRTWQADSAEATKGMSCYFKAFLTTRGHKEEKKCEEEGRNQFPTACTADVVADDSSGKEPTPDHVFLQQSLPSFAQQREAEVEAAGGRASGQPAQHPAVTGQACRASTISCHLHKPLSLEHVTNTQ